MSPSAFLDRISEALRGKDDKLPEIFLLLADARGKKTAAETWLAVSRAALEKGEAERCKGILEVYLEQDPTNSTACLLLSKACQQLGDVSSLHESVSMARAAVAHASGPDEALHASLQLALALGTRARVHTQQEVERQRDRAEAIQLLSNLGALTAAAAASPTPAAGAGATTPAASSASTPYVAALGAYSLAILQAEQGQPGAAMASARAALQLAEAAAEGQLTALTLALVAALLSSRRQFKLALSVLAAAPSSFPAPSSNPASPSGGAAAATAGPTVQLWSDVLVCRLRARLLAALGDVPGSLAALATCKRLLSGWAEGRLARPAGVSGAAVTEALAQVWCELALALAASSQRAEAMAAVDHALSLRPWAATTRHALGAVYEALGQYDEAGVSYMDALALDPTHAPSLLRQGALHARRGSRPDLAVAHDMLAEALRYDPAAAAAWYQLGRVAAALEHRAEAEGHLMTAVQLATAAPVLEYREMPLAPPA